jgi:hypothetical protein
MARDIYVRDDSAPKYQDNLLEVSDDISFLIMQIEMILFTNRTEVLGMDKFGVNLEELLFTFNANEGQLISKIMTHITSHCPLAIDYPVNVKCEFVKGVDRDIALIDIYIEGYKQLSVLL